MKEGRCAMFLKNATDFSDSFLRNVVRWCCRQMGMPISKVRTIEFRNKAFGYSGHCHVATGDIVCSLARFGKWRMGKCKEEACVERVQGADEFMTSVQYRATTEADMPRLQAEWQRQRVKFLVDVVAHELAHRFLYLEGCLSRKSRRYRTVSRGGSEHQTEWTRKRVTDVFDANVEALVAEWNRLPTRLIKTKPTVQERRQKAVLDALERWRRKLKLAQTKVRTYQRKARYYEKAVAAKRGGASDADSRQL